MKKKDIQLSAVCDVTLVYLYPLRYSLAIKVSLALQYLTNKC